MMEAVIGHKLDQRIVKQVTQGRAGNHNSAAKYVLSRGGSTAYLHADRVLTGIFPGISCATNWIIPTTKQLEPLGSMFVP